MPLICILQRFFIEQHAFDSERLGDRAFLAVEKDFMTKRHNCLSKGNSEGTTTHSALATGVPRIEEPRAW